MTPATPITGEQRRDATLPRVRDRRPLHVWSAQLSMLEAMQRRADRTGTSDDMTPQGQQYKGNAPWLGAAVRQLAEQDVIVRVGTVRSQRPSRKANEVKLWKIERDVAAALKIRDLRRLIDSMKKSEAAPGATGTGSTQQTFPEFTEKGFSNGQTL